MVFEKLKEILAEQLDVDTDSITKDSLLIEDLGADSLDAIDIVMSVEDEFKIEVPDEIIEKLKPSAICLIILKTIFDVRFYITVIVCCNRQTMFFFLYSEVKISKLNKINKSIKTMSIIFIYIDNNF